MPDKEIREKLVELIDGIFQDVYESSGLRTSDEMIAEMVDKIIAITN